VQITTITFRGNQPNDLSPWDRIVLCNYFLRLIDRLVPLVPSFLPPNKINYYQLVRLIQRKLDRRRQQLWMVCSCRFCCCYVYSASVEGSSSSSRRELITENLVKFATAKVLKIFTSNLDSTWGWD